MGVLKHGRHSMDWCRSLGQTSVLRQAADVVAYTQSHSGCNATPDTLHRGTLDFAVGGVTGDHETQTPISTSLPKKSSRIRWVKDQRSEKDDSLALRIWDLGTRSKPDDERQVVGVILRPVLCPPAASVSDAVYVLDNGSAVSSSLATYEVRQVRFRRRVVMLKATFRCSVDLPRVAVLRIDNITTVNCVTQCRQRSIEFNAEVLSERLDECNLQTVQSHLERSLCRVNTRMVLWGSSLNWTPTTLNDAIELWNQFRCRWDSSHLNGFEDAVRGMRKHLRFLRHLNFENSGVKLRGVERTKNEVPSSAVVTKKPSGEQSVVKQTKTFVDLWKQKSGDARFVEVCAWCGFEHRAADICSLEDQGQLASTVLNVSKNARRKTKQPFVASTSVSFRIPDSRPARLRKQESDVAEDTTGFSITGGVITLAFPVAADAEAAAAAAVSSRHRGRVAHEIYLDAVRYVQRQHGGTSGVDWTAVTKQWSETVFDATSFKATLAKRLHSYLPPDTAEELIRLCVDSCSSRTELGRELAALERRHNGSLQLILDPQTTPKKPTGAGRDSIKRHRSEPAEQSSVSTVPVTQPPPLLYSDLVFVQTISVAGLPRA
jgi:hypothetical protein